MIWIMLFQTPYNNIKFITNEDANPQFLEYYKFLKFIAQFPIENGGEFRSNLDKFQTIFLNCSTGIWEIRKPEIKEKSFEDMLKLNPNEQEIKEEKKKHDPFLKKKNFLDLFTKARKKDVMKNDRYNKY
jgi:hypothetical protein